MNLVLIGLGIRSLSMNVLAVPAIKRAIRRVTSSFARELAETLLTLATPHEVEKELKRAVTTFHDEYALEEDTLH